MNGASSSSTLPAIDLAREPDFTLGQFTVRPSSCELVGDGEARRVEPRVMQVLVTLAQANGAVVSRDELMTRCWAGLVVSEDAVTRAIGQVRRLALSGFAVETIPKIGYRLTTSGAAPFSPAPPSPPAALEHPGLVEPPALPSRPSRKTLSIAGASAALFALVLTVFALRFPPSAPEPVDAPEPAASLGTNNPQAQDRYLRAAGLLNAGGRENALRAEQLLREALALDADFHTAKETLIIALMSVANFVPERSSTARAEIQSLVSNEIADTPLAWRSNLIRGFQLATEGHWLEAEQALTAARADAPEAVKSVVDGLEIFIHGSVGRIADTIHLVSSQAEIMPLSRDSSRVFQQWMDRSGRSPEAEAEYERSRDLPGDRSAMELAALVRALGTAMPDKIEASFIRYRETDWGRAGDDALFSVREDRSAALALLREQIAGFGEQGAMPPFLAAAWASYYGDNVLAVEGLRTLPSALFATGGMVWDPIFSEARTTPEFKKLLRDLGYVNYWRVVGNWGDFCRPLGEDDFECM